MCFCGLEVGPAALNKAYRFAMDEREGEDVTDHRFEIFDEDHGVWRCQTQFSCTDVCPKDIPLTEHVQELKREAVKRNLQFWEWNLSSSVFSGSVEFRST